MARAKLGSMSEETVPQDLDLLEKEVEHLLDQQAKEAAASKFAANCNAPEKKKRKKAQAPSAFLKDAATAMQEKPENKGESKFLQEATATEKQPKNKSTRAELQKELGHIRRSKEQQYHSTARLLKGLAQGDDAAEQYAARQRPDLLMRLFKPSKA